MTESREGDDPDLDVKFIDKSVFVVHIKGTNPMEYLVDRSSLANEGKTKILDFATITNIETDKEHNITKLKVTLHNNDSMAKKKYFFLYEKGHISQVKSKFF